MQLTEEEILNILQVTGALEKGHFLLSSGLHSDRYVQCARVFQYPEYAEKLCEQLALYIKKYEFNKVVGPAMGGILPAYEISRKLLKQNIFAERENEEMTFKRGFKIEEGDNILIIEDVVTTGKSVFEVIEKIKQLGGKVSGVASIIDRSSSQVEFGVPFVPLLSMEIKNYDPSSCPLCEDNVPLVKPGSR